MQLSERESSVPGQARTVIATTSSHNLGRAGMASVFPTRASGCCFGSSGHEYSTACTAQKAHWLGSSRLFTVTFPR